MMIVIRFNRINVSTEANGYEHIYSNLFLPRIFQDNTAKPLATIGDEKVRDL